MSLSCATIDLYGSSAGRAGSPHASFFAPSFVAGAAAGFGGAVVPWRSIPCQSSPARKGRPRARRTPRFSRQVSWPAPPLFPAARSCCDARSHASHRRREWIAATRRSQEAQSRPALMCVSIVIANRPPVSSYSIGPGHRAERGRRYQMRILRHHAALVMWLRRLPVLEPPLDFRIGKLDVEPALGDIECDRVAVAKRCDRSADERFGRDMARHQPVRRARKTSVRHQRHRIAKSFSHQRRSDAEHLRHPRCAARTLVTNHHHVARFDLPLRYRTKRILFRVENARGSAMLHQLVPCHFDHASLGRKVALEDHEPASFLERILELADYFLA